MVDTKIRFIIFFAAKDGEALYSQEKLGADYGSDHERLIDKIRLKLKKVGKTIRTFRYGLNQILYNYTVEVTNRFKGLHLKLLIAKFRLKLKKVGKNIRPIRYDLNQFPHKYTVEVMNSFKTLDLIDRVPK